MEGVQCSVCSQSQAEFVCACVFPPFPVCSYCSPSHLEAAGVHSLVSIQALAAPVLVFGNEVCDICEIKPAVHFCLCTAPLPKFCKGCHLAHYQKVRQVHSMHSMSAYELVTSGRMSVETFRRKQVYINDFQLRIWDELVQFDAFARRVEGEFSALIGQITDKKAAVLADLQRLKVKLTAHLSAVQQTIEAKRYIESFEVTTALDEYILTGYELLPLPEADIFSGRLELREISTLLENSVSFAVQESLIEQESGQIPVLKGHYLRLFHRKTLQMTQMTLSQTTRIDHSTAYCFLSPNTLLAAGGISHNEVYHINIRSGQVERAKSLNTNRWWTGLFPYKGKFVYAFGGSNGNLLNSAEKYAIEAEVWTNVRSLMCRAKLCCSVCEHFSGLYMSGIEQKGSSIECFSLNSETFRLIRTNSVLMASILCCVGDELYQIQHDKAEFADLTSGPKVTFSTKWAFAPINNGQYWLCYPTQVKGGELVGVLNPCGAPFGLFRLQIAQGLFTQVANFVY